MRRSAFRAGFAAILLSISIIPSAPGLAQEVLSAEGETPDVRVEVRDLKRGDGDTVTLRLRLINEFGRAVRRKL